jgi:glucose-1-phosphate adenylyltransferase
MYQYISTEDVLGIIMAAGDGKRLMPLTKDRAKPAVPIAGNLRIIDFVLTNFIRSGIKNIYITVYYKFDSLADHIYKYWNFLPNELDEFIKIIPPQKRLDEDKSYIATGVSIHQNTHLIRKHKPKLVAVFAGDHVYYMDIRHMITYHQDKNSEATIAAIPIKISEAPRELDGRLSYGVIVTNEHGKVIDFQEKPFTPIEIPNKSGYFWASMGNYIFNSQTLIDAVDKDQTIENSSNDFGKDILPRMVKEGKQVYMYDFSNNEIPEMTEEEKANNKGFWMDIGDVDKYYEANMMLRSTLPKLNLYSHWSIRKGPTKTVFSDELEEDIEHLRSIRRGEATDSIIALGTIISGGTVLRSVLGSNIKIHSYTSVIDSVIFDNVNIERHCRIKNTIIDKDVIIPPNTDIGYDSKKDQDRGFFVSPKGIVVVPKGYIFQ